MMTRKASKQSSRSSKPSRGLTSALGPGQNLRKRSHSQWPTNQVLTTNAKTYCLQFGAIEKNLEAVRRAAEGACAPTSVKAWFDEDVEYDEKAKAWRTTALARSTAGQPSWMG